MSDLMEAPRDNLFRGLHGVPVELRTEADTAGTTMYGHFTKFNLWNEIDSWYEGRFMERTVPGSFKKTIAENRDRVKVQFDHGYDTFVGSAPLGPIDVLREEDEGPYYEVPLLDTDYNHDRVLPQLQGRLMDGTLTGSVLGASYRFRVTKEEWVEPSKASTYNPDKLPERTIREVSLYEFGPVVFPAQLAATSGVRSVSLTDHFLERQLARTGQAARAARQLTQIASPAAPGTGLTTPNEPPQALDGQTTHPSAKRSARVALAFADLS
jgi:HK97 family phage prohead protease